mmetsp:Transcript_44754/g.130308  ORF Transcript_44754/g.130308 Transcript_44754/m.130308 type:complete len:344 (-) Transcript_44754:195-1226(-)
MAFALRALPFCAVALTLAGLATGDSAAASDLALGRGGDQASPVQFANEAKAEPSEAGPPPTADSIARHLTQTVVHQLRSSHHQWINASVALIIGLAMVFDGQMVFKWVLLAAAFLLAFILAMSDLRAEWASQEHAVLRHIVGLEVGLAAAYAAWRGFEGLVVAVGALLGAVVAHFLQGWGVSMGFDLFQAQGPAIIGLYSVCVAAGILAFRFKKHAKALAILSSMLGSALVASAAAWGCTVWAIKHNAFDGLAPRGGAWLDFFELLWDPASPDVGLFAGSPYNLEFRGAVWRSDRLSEAALAFILSVVGTGAQLYRLRGAPEKSTKVAAARKLPLQEALLSEA